MHVFRVWAPFPKKVELQFKGKKYPMTPGEPGWWTRDVKSAKAGDDYGFILDRAGPYPDPRSASQRKGVYKLSRLVNQDGYKWRDKNFQAQPLSSAIIYELHI